MWLLAHSICLPEQEAEFLPTSSSDIELLAQSKLKVIPEKFCSQDSLTEAYLHSLSGMMSPHFDQTTPQPQAISNGCEKGVGNSSSVAGSPNFAKTSAQPEKARESTAQDQECGRTWRESFAKYNPDSCSWKTAQCSLIADSDEFSETWPRWGSMRNGECFPAKMPAAFTYESESGLSLPTPRSCSAMAARITENTAKAKFPNLETVLARLMLHTIGANEGKGSSKERFLGSPAFRGAKMSEGLRTCAADPIYLNPSFAELTMMWPLDWTDLKPLAMARFQEWRQQHGGCFLNDSTIKAA